MEQYTSRKKELYLNKIYRTNKIKEQFMKISSECKPCNCYNDFEEKYMEGKIDTGSNGLANASFKRIRTGTQWKMRQVNPEQ